MFNFARQGFANPFLSGVGAVQPGVAGSVGRCPVCGNAVTVTGTISTLQAPTTGFNPLAVAQQMPYGVSSGTGFGSINPLGSGFTTGITPNINPLAAQLGANWPVSSHFANQGVGRVGPYGIDPRVAFGTVDPNLAPVIGDPISSLLQHQTNPLFQQQLPIRSLIGSQQGIGTQQLIPGFASGVNQWADPYRAFIEAQLISQLAANPLYQLQRGYGGLPETTGLGMPFAGQSINPFFANVPFYG